ncbi:tripartite tricarboxylate transporter substrate binding protein [Variovorax sp.]|jgi:tripartite-type tricarboxylate transporter receptor subunit TctC|uniref:Bug family tripartite tricarboxylate transporter substrate binding protein n=1 Tax=Variovorax sp. TaxID=1871043 RepID=UPI000C558213|nr:tripartite tricarboxylate transporter substrate binding protein [Variovorax sp.]MBS79955.1 ABC transporter substrate-binding protein [Variovorax sp.]
MNLPRTLFAGLLLVAAGIAAPALAQGFPDRPVTLVVPYPAGGSADILARTVGQKLAAQLGQPVVVENKGGAGTAIGARFVAEAKPDGYTLLLGTVSSQAINPAMSKVGYDPVKDFVPVSALASIPFVLVAHPSAPYGSVAELLAAARQAPGSISYASAGPGTSNHLAGEMLASAAKLKLLHVPYRGSAPALADVLAGHVPLMFDLQTTSLPNIATHKLKPLAVTGSRRSPLLPDVPTVAESGLPGFEVSAWFGVFAPAKLPPPVLRQLSAAMAKVLEDPALAQRLREIGAEPDPRNAAQFTAYVGEEAGKYATVVKTAGLAP